MFILKLLFIPFLLFAEISIEVPEDIQGERDEFVAAVVIVSSQNESKVSRIKISGVSDVVYSQCERSYFDGDSCVFIIKPFLDKPINCKIEIFSDGEKKEKKIKFNF